MSRSRICSLSVLSLLLLGTFASAQQPTQRTYRCVDDNGVVRIGDRIPAECANADREVLNSLGQVVAVERGELTEEERIEADRLAAETAAREAAEAEARHRDRVLLETYLTVDDIVDMRDRRLELLESQIQVTQHNLQILQRNLASLEERAERFREAALDGTGTGVPPNISLDIAKTVSSIDQHETRLAEVRNQIELVKSDFDADIERFVELKGAAANR